MMKREIGFAAALCLAITASVLGQAAQPSPSPTPRRALPKPAAAKGFEKYAGLDSSARLVAGLATREALDPAVPAYERGETAYFTGKYPEAVAAFAEAVTLRPDWIQAHYALALSLTETDKLKAVAEFKQVLKLNAKDETKLLAHYDLGNVYVDLGQYAEAVESYKAAINLNAKLPAPPKSSPHYNLGLAYAALGQLTEAATEFKGAALLRPDHAEAHFNLGVTDLQLGKKHDAQEQQRLLLKLNPELAAKLDALIGQ